MIVICLWVMVSLSGCSDRLRQVGVADLDDPDTMVRVRAICWAGNNTEAAAVPELVERLAEEDESVRFFAITSLRRITGDDYGYDYKADAQCRAEALKRWREALAAGEIGPTDTGSETRKSEDEEGL